MTFTLQIGSSSPQTFTQHGITSAVLEESINGESSLVLETSQSFSASFLIAPFQECRLYADGVLRFIGWLDNAPRTIEASSRQIQYVLNGPYRWFERTPYTQNRAGLVYIAGIAGSGRFQPQSLTFSATEIVDQVSSFWGGSTSISSSLNRQMPTKARSDISCGDAFRTLLALTPDVYLRWSYGPNTYATFFMQEMPITATSFFNTDDIQLIQASIEPRYDLLYSSVRISWVRDNAVAATHTINLFGTDADQLNANRLKTYTYDTTPFTDTPNNTFATALANFYGKLRIDAEAVRYGIDWTDTLGQCWGFSGTTFTQYSSYTTNLTRIRRDLFAFSTNLEFGGLRDDFIFEAFNRSDFDRGAVPDTSTPSFTGDTGDSPFIPSGPITCPDPVDPSQNEAEADLSCTDLVFTSPLNPDASAGLSQLGLSVNCPENETTGETTESALDCSAFGIGTTLDNGTNTSSLTDSTLELNCITTDTPTENKATLNCNTGLEITNTAAAGVNTATLTDTALEINCGTSGGSTPNNSATLDCSTGLGIAATAGSNINTAALTTTGLAITCENTSSSTESSASVGCDTGFALSKSDGTSINAVTLDESGLDVQCASATVPTNQSSASLKCDAGFEFTKTTSTSFNTVTLDETGLSVLCGEQASPTADNSAALKCSTGFALTQTNETTGTVTEATISNGDLTLTCSDAGSTSPSVATLNCDTGISVQTSTGSIELTPEGLNVACSASAGTPPDKSVDLSCDAGLVINDVDASAALSSGGLVITQTDAAASISVTETNATLGLQGTGSSQISMDTNAGTISITSQSGGTMSLNAATGSISFTADGKTITLSVAALAAGQAAALEAVQNCDDQTAFVLKSPWV